MDWKNFKSNPPEKSGLYLVCVEIAGEKDVDLLNFYKKGDKIQLEFEASGEINLLRKLVDKSTMVEVPKDGFYASSEDAWWECTAVTHWMEKPEPPEE